MRVTRSRDSVGGPRCCFLGRSAEDEQLLKRSICSCAVFFFVLLFCRSACAQAWLNSDLARFEEARRGVELRLAQGPPVPVVQNLPYTGFHSGFAPTRDSVRWVQVDLGAEYPIDSVYVLPTTLNGGVAYGFPERYRIELGRDALLTEPELLVEADVKDPLSVLPKGVECGGRVARFVRLTALGLVPQPRLESRYIFCLGELLVFSGGRNVALNGTVLAPKSVTTLPTWSPSHLVDGMHALGVPSRAIPASTNGWHSGIFNRPDVRTWVQVDLGREALLDEIGLIPAHPPDYPDRVGFGFPRRFKLETSLDEDFLNGEIVYETGDVEFENPADTKVSFRVLRRKARFIRMTADTLWERSGDFVFALGELEAFEGRENVARSKNVTASSCTETRSWAPAFLVDGLGGAGALLEEDVWLRSLSEKRRLQQERDQVALKISNEGHVAQRRLGAIVALGVVGALVFVFLLNRKSKMNRRRELENLRQQISRDLHDDIGSNLCSIRLMAEIAAGKARDEPALEVLAEIKGLAEQGTESLRDMVWLVREGESPKIERLIEKMRSIIAGLLVEMECPFHVQNAPLQADAPLSFHRDILFILREALHNVVKHSDTRSAEVVFSWSDREIELVVEDRGRGFDSDQVMGGEGIENMRYRSARLNGTLLVESVKNKGTRLTVKMARR